MEFNLGAVIASITSTALITFLGILLRTGYKKGKELKASLDCIIDSQKAQQKYVIEKIHSKATKRGYITNTKLAVAEDNYKHYHAMKGNSYIDDIIKEIRSLPIKQTSIKT